MFKATTLQEISVIVREITSDFSKPLNLIEDKTAVEPRLNFKEKKIFFSNACISTILLYELYYGYKKYIHRILLYNVLISLNFQKGYLTNIAYLLRRLEQEINKFKDKNIRIAENLNTENIIYFLLGHELGHAQLKNSDEEMEGKLLDIRNIISDIYKDVKPKTLSEKIAFEGLCEYVNRKKIVEELACDRNGILNFFMKSISSVLKQHEVVEIAKMLVRIIALRQFPTNIATAMKTKLGLSGFYEYRNIHRMDVLRIGLATFSISECLSNCLDSTFVNFFTNETLTYNKVMKHTVFDWVKQFNTVAKVSTGQLVEDEKLFNNLQNIFDNLQLELIQAIEYKTNTQKVPYKDC